VTAGGTGIDPSGAEHVLASLTETGLYSIGAFFADRHPDLCDDVIAEAQAIEDEGLSRWAGRQDTTVDSAFQTLVTGLAVRYYKAVAGSAE
jgi:hypothetical protein